MEMAGAARHTRFWVLRGQLVAPAGHFPHVVQQKFALCTQTDHRWPLANEGDKQLVRRACREVER